MRQSQYLLCKVVGIREAVGGRGKGKRGLWRWGSEGDGLKVLG